MLQVNFLKDIKKTGGKFLLKTDESMWIFTGTEHAQFYRENIIIFLSDGEDAVPCNELKAICEFNKNNG